MKEPSEGESSLRENSDGINRRGFLQCMAWVHFNPQQQQLAVVDSSLTQPLAAGV
jgi:hypothetical protein